MSFKVLRNFIVVAGIAISMVISGCDSSTPEPAATTSSPAADRWGQAAPLLEAVGEQAVTPVEGAPHSPVIVGRGSQDTTQG